MIDLKDLGFSYPDAAALQGIDLRMEAGESVAVIGPNGSGKSTLLKLVSGLFPPSAGSYSYDGGAVTRESLAEERFAKAFHKRVGLLFQDSGVQLFCGSVYDEIAFGPRQMGLGDMEVERRVSDLVGLLGLGELVARVPYHLSGGEKRKVALASVLALGPELLCLDEPMGGLDPKTKRFLLELLKSLNASGLTLLCATHDFEYVDGLFDRAIVLSKSGRLVRDGPYEEIVGDRDFLAAMNIA
jgi:cobalt/nickel transport system ATP-binding protein